MNTKKYLFSFLFTGERLPLYWKPLPLFPAPLFMHLRSDYITPLRTKMADLQDTSKDLVPAEATSRWQCRAMFGEVKDRWYERQDSRHWFACAIGFPGFQGHRWLHHFWSGVENLHFCQMLLSSPSPSAPLKTFWILDSASSILQKPNQDSSSVAFPCLGTWLWSAEPTFFSCGDLWAPPRKMIWVVWRLILFHRFDLPWKSIENPTRCKAAAVLKAVKSYTLRSFGP